jgi:O-antigen chain-terminating methyltransferase
MLFWYTPALQRALEELAEALDVAIQATQQSEGSLAQQQMDHRLQVEMRITELENRLREQTGARIAELENRLREQTGAELENRLREQTGSRIAELENRLREQTGARIAELENRLREQADTRIAEILPQERLRLDALLEARENRFSKEGDLAKRLKKAEEYLQLLRREIVQQSRRVSFFLEESRKSMPAPPDEKLRAFEQEDLHELDPFYVSFEDTLRGPREEIREQFRVYLPFLDKAKAAPGERAFSLLDIGCGRGEWLELLRQHGFSARGIDFNRFMVEECRARELDVQQADALDYLGSIPDSSLGAITAFHVVEHLPLPKLICLLGEMIRVLQPGGVVILETPNPDNILVGARNFYFDPSHRNPIPSETLRFLVEARGLCQVEVLPLHPCDPCNEVPPDKEESLLVQRFNQYFYGPQDYAIIGRKL